MEMYIISTFNDAPWRHDYNISLSFLVEIIDDNMDRIQWFVDALSNNLKNDVDSAI